MQEQFSNRWGIVLASLGMAIGAGNLWRFPRLAGQYGGTFIVLWIVFLLLWSIPILLTEFAIGKTYKKSVIVSMGRLMGRRWIWVGFFITFCTLFITFYYATVTAWGLRYFFFALQELFSPNLTQTLHDHPQFLEQYWLYLSNANLWTILFQIGIVVAASLLLYRGVQGGLEKANRILIPSLFVLLFIVLISALSRPQGWQGLEYMFTIRWELFLSPQVWIEALSQSAWSTGAGWGLVMTISAYSRADEDVTLNTFISGFGNNTASLISGMAILPAVFALAPSPESAMQALQSGNQSLCFIVIPKLFSQMSGGALLSVIFFLAFFLAAFSSFLPMLELFIKMLQDFGFLRSLSILIAGISCILFGLPSAYNLDIFSNQDWVWGIGLIISGFLMAFSAFKFGIFPFKKLFIDTDSSFRVPELYFVAAMFTNLGLAILLVYWWMSQGYSAYPWWDAQGNWNFFDVYSNATILSQWLFLMLVALFLNNWLYRKLIKDKE